MFNANTILFIVSSVVCKYNGLKRANVFNVNQKFSWLALTVRTKETLLFVFSGSSGLNLIANLWISIVEP